MADPKDTDGKSFAELVGQVNPVKASPRRVPEAAPVTDRVRVHEHAKGAHLIVEKRDDLVLAHSTDYPPSKLAELAHGPTPPSRELDLHGMGVAKARAALERAVTQARRDGLRCLVVICGRGHRSGPSGPVLPDVVMDELAGPLAGHVLGFRSAPRHFGGAGALIVRLRSRRVF